MPLLFADQEIISGRNAKDAHARDIMLDEELFLPILKHSHSDIIHWTLFEISEVLSLRLVVEQSWPTAQLIDEISQTQLEHLLLIYLLLLDFRTFYPVYNHTISNALNNRINQTFSINELW